MVIILRHIFLTPPFISLPIERIKNEKLRHGVRFAKSIITAGLAASVTGNSGERQEQDDPFAVLSGWVPYFFLNPSDYICS